MNGITGRGPCKNPGGEIQATIIYAALRNKSVDDLIYIKENSTKKQGVENDVKECLNTFENPKSCMFFFPYVFDMDIKSEPCRMQKAVEEALNSDFSGIISYRERLIHEHGHVNANKHADFFVTLCKNEFLIFKLNSSGMTLIDHVPTSRVETFIKLQEYNSMC